ncbi:ABC transporter permease [Natronoflexus pectinivorans]|uniref:Putative ABC transport system permease protein n=1 Tax=Natronoflexus pectinivorans TaxID=682526 RepID=A0A4V2RWH8_9BACT|nr:ABC transporter permease [Natronoflexus pectinivorans]TCO08446.1 putative ABC transport system permease protein [Natronoflexus pectinivorans]
MIDYLEEIFSTLKQNKLRAIMTGFSVAWGIFMLLLLLGSGKGLQNGMEYNFRGSSTNAIWIHSGETGESYEGLGKGRRIQFTNEDYDMLKRELAGIKNISGRMYLRSSAPLTYKNEFGIYTITGVMPEYNGIEILDMQQGRFVNRLDIDNYRKVIVLSQPIVDVLFKDEDPMGKYIKAGGVPFQVVGTFYDYQNQDARKAFIPISTGQRVFGGANRLANLAITTASTSVEENKQIESEIKSLLARRHRFSETDDRAIFIWNTLEHFRQAQGVFAGIRMFVWVIGIMTIIAGIVGVSNIMIILVKERTREIGIRKSIGATPWSVIRLVLSESVFITAVAGFFGLLFGMGVLHLANMVLMGIAEGNDMVNRMFYNPSADFGVAVSATLILIAAGLIAGFIPARKAAAIKPIEALHDE